MANDGLTQDDIWELFTDYIAYYPSLRQAAKAIGISPAYLSKVNAGEQPIFDGKILAAIGVEKVVTYRLTDAELRRIANAELADEQNAESGRAAQGAALREEYTHYVKCRECETPEHPDSLIKGLCGSCVSAMI